MRRLVLVAVLGLVAGCASDILGVGDDDGDWEFSEGEDSISREPYAQAVLETFDRMDLVVRCREGEFDVFVSTDFVTASGAVRYRIDDDPFRSETWSEAVSFDALFYPGNARPLADRLTNADEMVFEARQFGGTLHETTFRVSGLENALPRVLAAC